MRLGVGVGVGLVLVACRGERTGTVAGPPLMVATATATATPTSPSAEFHDLSATGIDVPFAACHEVLVTAITGSAAVDGEQLAPGDVIAVRGLAEKKPKLSGQGISLVVAANDEGCVTRKRVVRASQASVLRFAGDAMRAQLDVDDREIASFYLGRLSGTAGVPEHMHDQSWEILCAFEASGTFTVGDKESRLGPRTCVSIPPRTKHSWTPDRGSNLVAVQMYSPPGPEQRFKKLAADEATHDR
jgi:mannose-6-phosphate isomerase-like protein (cupin superfamily)